MKIYVVYDNLAHQTYSFWYAVNVDVAKRQFAAFCVQNPVVAPDCSLLEIGDFNPESLLLEKISPCFEVMNHLDYVQSVSEREVPHE